MSDGGSQRYFSASDLAAYLSVSEARVDQMVASGALPLPIVFGATARFSRDAVDEAMSGRGRRRKDDDIDELIRRMPPPVFRTARSERS